jgi:hypothetical protein
MFQRNATGQGAGAGAPEVRYPELVGGQRDPGRGGCASTRAWPEETGMV